MFECANTRKHVSEQSLSSVRVFLSIPVHLAHFFLILNRINECFDVTMHNNKTCQ